MKEFWNTIQLIFTGIGGWLGYFLGGWDGLLYALIAFVVIDYLTGVMCATVSYTHLDVYKRQDKDITDTLEADNFIWHRKSSDEAADAEWDKAHRGIKTIIITTEDVQDNASFYCEIIL